MRDPDRRYLRAQAIVHEVLDLTPGERPPRLDALVGDDTVLRGEVEWLIAALLEQVEAMEMRLEPEMHARTAATRAAIRRARGDGDDARRLDRIAYELTLRDVGAEHPRTARYALAYARALRQAGEADQAQALEREYLPRLARAYPADSAFRQPGKT